MHMAFSMKVTPEIEELTNICLDNSKMDVSLYGQYDVKRGLRDINGVGVLAGLTQISNVVSSDIIDGVKTPCDGRLYYRGINVEKLTQGFLSENRMGFEEVAYLLLFGNLPNEEQLNHFKTILKQQQSLPKNFVRDVVMKAPTKDMMNTLSRSVLTLYAYDNHADDTSLPNVLRQCINLISVFPMLSVYGYQAYNHYIKGKSLYIHNPSKKLSTAENILLMLRPDQKYTPLEAKILDLALVLHMEHGGGNNSAFPFRVVSSSGSDTYSAIASAICSLKGPKHGGANIKVQEMFDYVKQGVNDWNDDDEVTSFLERLIRGEEGDHSGLIYGMGHAIYTLSDPRAVMLKHYAMNLARGTEFEREFELLQSIERLSPAVFARYKQNDKNICANVDLYSGLVYRMLGIPTELYTPLFAIARIAGWCAHRIEEVCTGKRIIRPAYKAISKLREYTPLESRSSDVVHSI